ncbi:asparagine synthase-related protein [Gordonia sputi]|uniref:asparagine synthase-related protein n=1 Tax=Gordonia sputi TaxID=36823 RepID=UPI002042CA4D|nr:asparagine synthase-related protein [Gordonia sputi]MCM3895776.1 asparagine synthase-related protein [Gordonia sputi]
MDSFQFLDSADIRNSASLREAISSAVNGQARIGVLVSGGLDSAAVLYLVSQIVSDPSRVVALNASILDNEEKPSHHFAEKIVNSIDPDIELHICYESDHQPSWNHEGPRLDSAPQLNDQIYKLASEIGCTILLTGNGADEICAAPRFLFSRLARGGRIRGLLRYFQDTVAYSLEAAVLEPTAVLASAMPAAFSTRLYSKLCSPEDSWNPPEVLADEFKSEVATWSADWLAELNMHRFAYDGRWAQLDAMDSLLPVAYDFAIKPVPVYSPFRDMNVMRSLLNTKLEDRYGEHHTNPYWRLKSTIVDIFPERVLVELPNKKQVYGSSLKQIQHRDSFPSLGDAQIIKPSLIQQGIRNRALAARLDAMETWLSTALASGYRLVD